MKLPTWEAVNPQGDYIIVRTKERAQELVDTENELIEENDPCYYIREGKLMTDEELKQLPELEEW